LFLVSSIKTEVSRFLRVRATGFDFFFRAAYD